MSSGAGQSEQVSASVANGVEWRRAACRERSACFQARSRTAPSAVERFRGGVWWFEGGIERSGA
eukprot:1993848-Alexandrium_andersonii.AAC.1